MSDTKKRPLTFEEAMQPTTEQPSKEVLAWQEKEILRGLKEADAGDFATAEEVRATILKFVPHG